jgi:hypothetical protein
MIQIRFRAALSAAAIAVTGATSAHPAAAQQPAATTLQANTTIQAGTTLEAALRIAERYRVAAITGRRFTHAELWRAIGPSVGKAPFRVEEAGRSIQGREIRAVHFGDGPTTVLLWSQMHGDESTATMALADIFRFLAEATSDPLRERLRRNLSVTFVPMLNPDGAQLFQRENAAGIDVNRDGRQQATPEARALKGLRDRIEPRFGFNLHDQSARTRVGPSGRQAAIALLAPAHDSTRGYNEVRGRARLVAAVMARMLADSIPGRVAKYDDTFNPRAFGDLMQQWGASTVLIESGALEGDPQKQRLRALNAAIILGALDAIATRGYEAADTASYEALPENAGGANDLVIVGGQLVLPGKPPLRADIAINFDDGAARAGGRVREVGDLRHVAAIDTVDATGLFLHPAAAALTTKDGGTWLRIGADAQLDIRRTAEPASELVRRIGR